MLLVVAFLLLTTCALGYRPLGGPTVNVGVCLGAATVSAIGLGLAAKVTSLWGVRAVTRGRNGLGGRDDLGRVVWSYCTLRHVHLVCWLTATGLTLFVFGWIAWVRAHVWQVPTRLLESAAILLPGLVSWWVSSVGFAPADRLMQAGQWEDGWFDRWSRVWDDFRAVAAMAIVPVVLVFAWLDFCTQTCAGRVTEHSRMWLEAAGVIVLAGVFPPWLIRLWPTRSLPESRLRECLTELTSRTRIAVRDIVTWRTTRGTCNAAAVGSGLRLYYVVLTDGLLSRLSRAQVVAAFAHELGHVYYRHGLVRLCWIVLPLGWWCLLTGGQSSGRIQPATIAAAGIDSWQALGATATLFYLVFGLGWLARRLEHQADRWAYDQLSQMWGPERALEIYGGMLRALTPTAEYARSGWMHPSVRERCRHLRCYQTNTPTTALTASKCGVSEPRLLRYALYVALWLPYVLFASRWVTG